MTAASNFNLHVSAARQVKNAACAIVIFVVLSATLFGSLLFSPENDTAPMGASRKSLFHHPLSSNVQHSAQGTEVDSRYQWLDSGDSTTRITGVEQRAPVSLLLKGQKQKVLQNIATEKEMLINAVDHAKLANVVSISASAAILLGAFTAGKLAKRRLGPGGGGEGVFVESDSNAGRISDDVAYDIAYTSTASEISYGSFTSTWAGDLEKFDV